MIATPEFVFVHLHKTGGQFVNRLLLQHYPGAHTVGYHQPRSEAPESLRALPAFAFTRNPWDWYVSWYAFNREAPLRNPIFRAVSKSGAADFHTTIHNLLHLGHPLHVGMREEIAASLPETREGNQGSGITRSVMRRFTDPDAGYLSWLMRYMCFIDGSPAGVRVGIMENLRQELPELIRGCGGTVNAEFAEAITAAPPVNASPRRDYREYYDTELRGLVAERDWTIVESYNYSF